VYFTDPFDDRSIDQSDKPAKQFKHRSFFDFPLVHPKRRHPL